MTDTQSLRDFYLTNVDGAGSIFRIWERGGAVGDSITPSTHSGPYREWMRDLLGKLLDESEPPGLLSIGCGNAVIEAELAAAGCRVLCVDALEEAVELARGKGVPAVCADIRSWTPPPGPWTVLYADGVFGHLYDDEAGIAPVLRRLRSWLAPGGTLVVSNDGPRGAADVERHPDVPGFTWLSDRYLRSELAAAGYDDVVGTLFTYDRPVSGPRTRVIVTARAHGVAQPPAAARAPHRH